MSAGQRENVHDRKEKTLRRGDKGRHRTGSQTQLSGCVLRPCLCLPFGSTSQVFFSFWILPQLDVFRCERFVLVLEKQLLCPGRHRSGHIP